MAGISATPYADNLRYFAVSVEGPSDSPYERGVFQLELFLPADYPMSAPKVRFLIRLRINALRQAWQWEETIDVGILIDRLTG